jgi:NADH:ubiquinone oxidoreductase subunit
VDRGPANPYISAMTIGTRLFTWFNGRLVGRDAAGNAYYEHKRAAPGERPRRWVIFAGAAEATKVPAEWHPWLHYTTDQALPDQNRRAWQKPHLPNMTGTAASYRPPGHDYQGGQRARATGDYESWTPGS